MMVTLFRRYHPVPLRDAQPMTGLLKMLFVIFIGLLWLVATMLFLRVGNVFPWDLVPRTSSLVGAMFFGASAPFAYALYRNSWVMAGGAILGFLAYDVGLVIPYVKMIGRLGDDGGGGSPVYGSFAAPRSARRYSADIPSHRSSRPGHGGRVETLSSEWR